MPFGQANVTVATVENNLRFAGQDFDAETGLHYNYWRYYDPKIGRYLRADPIGLDGGINLYSYVLNNPINLTDHFGNEPCDCEEKKACEEKCKNSGGMLLCKNDNCEKQAQKIFYPKSRGPIGDGYNFMIPEK